MASSKYAVGTKHKTKQGELVVLELINKNLKLGIRNQRAVIMFTGTGWTANVQTSNIMADKVKDKRLPTVYGVGYLDTDMKIPARGTIIRRVYDLWANMLKRAYHDTNTRNWDYYKDVTVDRRWHSFSHFLNTIIDVEGYDLWEKDSSMHLDKDIKVSGNKTYCKDSCKFVTNTENARAANYKRWHGK